MSSLSTSNYCDSGYICKWESVTRNPIDGTKGIACRANYYCPAGTAVEIRCPDGTYQPDTGMGSCKPCPAGYSCYYKKAEADITISSCPTYYYCPGGNSLVGIICPPGTSGLVGTSSGLKDASQCLACGTGKYCVDAEKDSMVASSCAAGYYCIQGATNPAPNDPFAKLCSPGFYCTLGAQTESQCPYGKFREEAGARSSDECSVCQPGQYCERGNPVPYRCPTGHYCPLGTSSPIPCPIGTYLSTEKGASKADCIPCPAGYLCYREGTDDYVKYPCPASHYCLEHALVAIACLAGFYLPQAGTSMSDCKPCQVHYYCKQGTTSQEFCPDGFECPVLSPAPSACEEGYYCVR